MAFDSSLQISIQNRAGLYYTAQLNADATYSISTTSTRTFIKVLPDGWAKTRVSWERNMDYLGIFRSMSSNADFIFSKDGRAIIEEVRRVEGRKGYALLTIWLFDTSGSAWDYRVFYRSLLNFAAFNNNMQTELLSIGFLDGELYRDLQAFGSNKINVPIFDNSGTDEAPIWSTTAPTVIHDGLKLLYKTIYESKARPDDLLKYNAELNGNVLVGWNRGQFGTGDHAGYHQTLNLHTLNEVQNNGSTTFIGNDILNVYLKTFNQNLPLETQLSLGGFSCYIGEEVFWGANASRPFSTDNCSIHSYLPANGGTIKMSININAFIEGNVDQFATDPSRARVAPYLGFVMWEIDKDDKPPIVSLGGGDSGMTFIDIHKFPLNIGTSGWHAVATPGGAINVTKDVDLNYNKAYVFGLIYEDDSSPRRISDAISHLEFSKLTITLQSKYDSGASGVPIAAPYFPPSLFSGYRPHQLLEKLVPYLATRRTNGYGFPVPVTTDYTGVSSYLSDPSATPIGDAIPYQTLISSFYCLHNLEGQSYVSIALNDLFKFCKNVFGCGAAIENDSSGNPTIFRMEKIDYFFDSSTMILDLGADVAQFEIEEIDFKEAANLKLGYTKAETNSDFGVDTPITQTYFSTPLADIPGTIDMQENDILVDPYAQEKGRAERVDQPVGTEYDPANPSTDNRTTAYYIQPTTTQYLPAAGGNPTYPTLVMRDPSNNAFDVNAYQLTMRDGIVYPGVPCAQSTDPGASSAPYIFGLYYPDRFYNIELTPARNAFKRGMGKYLHSIYDKLDTEYLTFRNTYQMQYNNKVIALSGTESNLNIGSGTAGVITEFKDVPITDLPAKIFKPTKFKVLSKYPVNMYQIFASNPNGYIRFLWRKPDGFGYNEYKGFIMKVEQAAATNEATYFELLATPDYAG